MTSAPPSPSWPEQVQAIALEAKEVADSVRSDADAGKFNGQAGAGGEDGGYYTPEVTQTSENTMQVAFSPSKTSMPAVSGTEITLPAGQKGDKGDTGATGADGKSAYAYAVEGGYTGTEEEFAAKLAAEKFANPNALTFTGAVTRSYDGSAPLSVEIPSGGSGAYPVLDMTADTAELAPNTYYKWGEIAALTITLGAEIAGITNEYCFEFISGATATELTVPNDIKWAQEPSIEAGKTYQVSILNKIGVIVGA